MSKPYIGKNVVSLAEPPFGTHAPRRLQSALIGLAQSTPLHRGTFRDGVSKLIRSLGTNQTIDIARNGARFRVRGQHNLIENGILIHPTYNKVEIDFLIDGTPDGGTFIDLGANIGLYTLPLALKAGVSGQVLAIDVNPNIVAALKFNIEATGLTNVTIACVAVSDHEARARLEIRKNDLAIVEVVEDPTGDFHTRPLLDVVNEAGLDEVHCMKADIEGFEDKAILPYLENCSEAQKPDRIVIEHLTQDIWETDCFPVFAHHGYQLIRKTRGNSLFQRG